MTRAIIRSELYTLVLRFALWFMLTIAAVFVASTAVIADSWMPPSTEIFLSANQKSRVTITPRDLDSPLEYFRDKVNEKEDPGLPQDARNLQALAVVEMKSDTGEWVFVWKTDLVNEIAPVSAIVSDDGSHLVTFDNWHSVGYGPSAIVYYNQKEGLKRQFDLSYFLPTYYIEALPRSVSSRSWKKGDATIEGDILRLEIIVPSRDSEFDRKKIETVGFQIDLHSGYVSKQDTVAWTNALLSALAVQKDQLEYETLRIKALTGPLTAKAEMSERDWHEYLREAYWRLIDANGTTATKHLRPLHHEQYQKSVQWIMDEFAEMAEESEEEDWFLSDVSIASSNQENLVQLLSGIAEKAKPNDYRWGRALIIVDKKHWPRLQNAFAHTGLNLLFADPAEPIASSPDRLKRVFNPDPQSDDEFDLLKDL